MGGKGKAQGDCTFSRELERERVCIYRSCRALTISAFSTTLTTAGATLAHTAAATLSHTAAAAVGCTRLAPRHDAGRDRRRRQRRSAARATAAAADRARAPVRTARAAAPTDRPASCDRRRGCAQTGAPRARGPACQAQWGPHHMHGLRRRRLRPGCWGDARGIVVMRLPRALHAPAAPPLGWVEGALPSPKGWINGPENGRMLGWTVKVPPMGGLVAFAEYPQRVSRGGSAPGTCLGGPSNF